jgi:hypothetical protein
MDLLVLADIDGCVNMTASAIARTTNVPLEQVTDAIEALSMPDVDSQNKSHDGRRLVPIEEGRSWGWRIVSYQEYRKIRDEEQRREYHRDYYEKKIKPKRKSSRKVKPAPKYEPNSDTRHMRPTEREEINGF